MTASILLKGPRAAQIRAAWGTGREKRRHVQWLLSGSLRVSQMHRQCCPSRSRGPLVFVALKMKTEDGADVSGFDKMHLSELSDRSRDVLSVSDGGDVSRRSNILSLDYAPAWNGLCKGLVFAAR